MRILVFGDSITQGFNDESNGGWCNQLISFVQNKSVNSGAYDKSVVNLGISGDTSKDILNRVEVEVEARVVKYPGIDDVCLIAVGVNDSQFEMSTLKNKISTEDTLKNICKIFSTVDLLVKQVVIIGIAPVFDERVQPMQWKQTHGYSNREIAKYNFMLKKFAKSRGLIFIDLDTVYEGFEKKYLPDGIHPNAEGHRRIFGKVKEELQESGIL